MDDALTTATIVGLSGWLYQMYTVTCKIMLSSVVVEHCCLLGSECWSKFYHWLVYYWRWITLSFTVFIGEL